ncbi:hypothetical protein pipiens_002119 [Culex pipiens pipiens]|uniref:DDE-1 domain-containing protein n=1 Tax=Culex pipiens pipiens TaxID=38569 RepID=A0ABD1DNR3_CULPP
MQALKKKQKTLSLVEKVQIIDEFESDGGTHEALGRKYGVGSSTVTSSVKPTSSFHQKFCEPRQNCCSGNYRSAEFTWIMVSFFSDGWMRRFRNRFGLQVKRVAGEKASADKEAYFKFKVVFLEKLIFLKLKMSQVYNADESALFIKMLASRSIVLSNEKTPAGRKMNRVRYTFLPCANMDGSHKLKLMFIGTAAKPRCLGKTSDLPVSYYSSKKAWMTRQLFKTWFHQEFVPAVRKFSADSCIEPRALLLLDNCTAHHDGVDGLISDDGLIQVMFLPPNVTSECQPMDQAVINATKTRYKRKLMLKLILENEHLKFEDRLKKITLQDCIDWIAEAWDEISPMTIQNSWKKLVDHFPDGEFCPLETDEEFDMWVRDRMYDVDNNPAWLTSEVFSDEEILDSVLNPDVDPVPVECELGESMDDTSFDRSSGSVGDFPLEPEFPDAMKAVDCLMSFVRNVAADLSRLKALRTKLIEIEWRKRAL